MKTPFYKYHGTGNDFVIIDNRKLFFDRNNKILISKLCDRKFGIGADGLILLQDVVDYNFEMVYFNADGNESTMCGNGGRCIVDFANMLGIINDKAAFLAIDGPHEATVNDKSISLSMSDVNQIEINPDYCFMDTGSPHYKAFIDNIDDVDVVEEGKKIRYNDRFREAGVNVNFLEMRDQLLYVRTYERGVEDETLSCGTGMVAAALYSSLKGISERSRPSTPCLPAGKALRVTPSEQSHSERSRTICNVITPGGEVKVKFTRHKDNTFTNILLEGPASFVFKGEIDV